MHISDEQYTFTVTKRGTRKHIEKKYPQKWKWLPTVEPEGSRRGCLVRPRIQQLQQQQQYNNNSTITPTLLTISASVVVIVELLYNC